MAHVLEETFLYLTRMFGFLDGFLQLDGVEIEQNGQADEAQKDDEHGDEHLLEVCLEYLPGSNLTVGDGIFCHVSIDIL